MVKSISTIYIDALILAEAKQQHLEISRICEEALKCSIGNTENTGTTAGALGNFLNHQAEKNKDFEIVKKLRLKSPEKYNQGLKILQSKYNLDWAELVKRTQ